MPCCPGPKDGKPFDPECEGPSAADLERFGSDVARCPNCSEEVYHDIAMCPQCGAAIEDRAMAGKPKKWILVAAGMGLAAFVFVIIR